MEPLDFDERHFAEIVPDAIAERHAEFVVVRPRVTGFPRTLPIAVISTIDPPSEGLLLLCLWP